MKMYKKMAKSISYSPIKRNRKDVKYIVIHYTGNSNDTAKNNADYYATGNTRLAGAHFFVDKLGNTARSIPMNRTAWAVGGAKYADCKATGGGKYYSKCTNYNSVSIELCGCTEAEPYSKEQVGNGPHRHGGAGAGPVYHSGRAEGNAGIQSWKNAVNRAFIIHFNTKPL